MLLLIQEGNIIRVISHKLLFLFAAVTSSWVTPHIYREKTAEATEGHRKSSYMYTRTNGDLWSGFRLTFLKGGAANVLLQGWERLQQLLFGQLRKCSPCSLVTPPCLQSKGLSIRHQFFTIKSFFFLFSNFLKLK